MIRQSYRVPLHDAIVVMDNMLCDGIYHVGDNMGLWAHCAVWDLLTI